MKTNTLNFLNFHQVKSKFSSTKLTNILIIVLPILSSEACNCGWWDYGVNILFFNNFFVIS